MNNHRFAPCRTGSPPQVRGKPSLPTYPRSRRRITPAGAGKTALGQNPINVRQDHPRGCGENRIRVSESGAGSGSPPRMRGKRYAAQKAGFLTRITPADAGKTCLSSLPRWATADHPRGCGENFAKQNYTMLDNGSPPRMRGKPSRLHCCTTHTRITPADAGKTQKTHLLNHTYQDHPRACGENQNIFYLPSGTEGSPPRMRGKQSPCPHSAIFNRITPAHAGKTPFIFGTKGLSTDHPRACGENSLQR